MKRISTRLEILSNGNNEGGERVFYILGWLECFLDTLLSAFLVFAAEPRDREAKTMSLNLRLL